MKESTKKTIAPLLRVLRSYPVLEEARETAFYLRGQDFVHFHETADGVIADILLTKGRVSMSVCTASEQAELLDRVSSRLESLEQHDRHRQYRRTNSQRRDAVKRH